MIGLTKTVAREYAGRSITCNAVAPGYIESDMTNAIDPKYKEGILKAIPLGKIQKVTVSESSSLCIVLKCEHEHGTAYSSNRCID